MRSGAILLPVACLLAAPACTSSAEHEGEPTAEAERARAEGPKAVIEAYYQALSRRDYATAWQLWGKEPAADDDAFRRFVDGFKDTELAIAEVGQPGAPAPVADYVHVRVPVHVEDLRSDGTGSGYDGTYTVRRMVDDPASWHIYEGNLRR